MLSFFRKQKDYKVSPQKATDTRGNNRYQMFTDPWGTLKREAKTVAPKVKSSVQSYAQSRPAYKVGKSAFDFGTKIGEKLRNKKDNIAGNRGGSAGVNRQKLNYDPFTQTPWGTNIRGRNESKLGYSVDTGPRRRPTQQPSYESSYNQLIQQQLGRENQRASDYQRALRESFERQNEALMGQIPGLEEGFERYKGRINENLQGTLEGLEGSKGRVEELYGEAMRRGAQAGRETQGQLQNLFASLGTVDSSAYAGQAQRAAGNLASQQQSLLRGQAEELAGIENQMRQAQIEAADLIDQEQMNLRNTINEIRQTVGMNDIEKEQAIRNAVADAEDRVFNIESQLLQMQQEAQNYEPKTKIDLNQLSETFLATGIPETREDYIYQLQNRESQEQNVNPEAQIAAQQGLANLNIMRDQLGLFGGAPKIMGGRFDAAKDALAVTLAQAQNPGRAPTDGDIKVAYRQLPSRFDSARKVRQKLDNIETILNSAVTGQYSPAGVYQNSNLGNLAQQFVE